MKPPTRLVLLPVLLCAACARQLDLPSFALGTVRGRVVSAGEPVAGAVVKLERTGREEVSRADGRFVLRGVPAGAYTLSAARDEDGDGVFERQARVPIELRTMGEDADAHDLDLQPAASVGGTVRSAGRPLGGALVFVPGSGRLAATDAGGRYRLQGVPPGTVVLAASAEGFVPASRELSLSPGALLEDADHELAAATGATASFTGRVRLSSRPDDATGATVLAFEDGIARAAADAAGDGSFRAGPLPPGVYELRFDAPGFATRRVTPLALGAADADAGEIWLEAGAADGPGGTLIVPEPPPERPRWGSISGRVLAQAQPAAGASVRLAGSTASTVARLDGTFLLPRVPLGAQRVEIGRDAQGDGVEEIARRLQVQLTEEAPDASLGDVELLAAGSVAGRVRSAAGPLAGATVFVEGARLAARSDAEGRYLLAGVAPGPARLGASATGFGPAVLDVDVGAGEATDGVDLVLDAATDLEPQRAPRFRGSVRRADVPEAIVDFEVRAFEAGQLRADAVGDAQGGFELGPLAPGLYEIRVDSPGCATLRVPTAALPVAGADLGTLWLAPGAAEPPGPGEPLPTDPPPALGSPRDLVATPGDARVTLSWNAPEAGADTYVVWRSEGTDEPAALNAGAPTAARVYADAGVVNYRTYTYRVTARLRGAESPLASAPVAQAVPGPGTVLFGRSGTRTLTPAGNPWVIAAQDLTVAPGETLTIEPGTELKFDAGRRLWVSGTLVAKGTGARTILFGKLGAGGWRGIVFDAGSTDAVLDAQGQWASGSVLAHAVVEGSTETGVTIVESAPLLDEAEIRLNSQYTSASVSYGGGLRIGAGAAPLVRRCSIHHNVVGVLEDDTTSTQWGAGVWSEGSPVLLENRIEYNELRATDAGTSHSYGGGVYLKAGQATLAGNRIAANGLNGSGQSNTGQTVNVQGLAVYVDSGSHLLAGNVVESHSVNEVPMNGWGTVAVRAGAAVLLHNRISGNRIVTTSGTMRGGALWVDQAQVRGFFNETFDNAISGGVVNGSVLWSGGAALVWRLNNFLEPVQAPFEVYNTGAAAVDLRSNHFAGLTAHPLSERVYRLAAADTSDLRAEPVAGAGPQPCQQDGDCAALGGAQTCHWRQCVPACFTTGCPAIETCDPQTGACVR